MRARAGPGQVRPRPWRQPQGGRRAAARRGARDQKLETGKVDIQRAGRRRHRADRHRRHRAAGDPRLRRRACHAQAERRQGGADGRYARRPDSRRVDGHELDRSAARLRRPPPPVADANALFPRAREGRAPAVQARRADDFTWPRPQTTAEVVTREPPPVAPARPGPPRSAVSRSKRCWLAG